MYHVTSDPDTRRLHIVLQGHLEGPERQEAIQAILAEATRLGPGFEVITDITDLHASNKDGFRDFLRVKSALKLMGVGRIIRVVKLPISRIQVERISETAGYQAEHADSLAEAHRLLDEARQTR